MSLSTEGWLSSFLTRKEETNFSQQSQGQGGGTINRDRGRYDAQYGAHTAKAGIKKI